MDRTISRSSPYMKLGIDRLPKELCGGRMFSRKPYHAWLPILLVCLAVAANAQSFRVQCPTTTITHPAAANVEPLVHGGNYFFD